MLKIILPKLNCLRCGYYWIPRKNKKPEYCAKCNNRYWNKPRKEKNKFIS